MILYLFLYNLFLLVFLIFVSEFAVKMLFLYFVFLVLFRRVR